MNPRPAASPADALRNARPPVLIVYGADWCDDTRRSLRHLRRLGVSHRYVNIDEDLDALERATRLNGGARRTPIIDLGFGGAPLVEPDNDLLTGALVERDMLSDEQATERLAVQNVGDFERIARTLTGVLTVLVGRRAPRAASSVMVVAGAMVGLSGLTGWCPVYQVAGVTSMGGPGDRPDEAGREAWLAARATPGTFRQTAAPVPDRYRHGAAKAGQ